MIKILIADDHRIFLDGLRAILKNDPKIHIEAEAVSGEEVLLLLKQSPVDIVVLDVEMGGGKSGIETAEEIRSTYPHIRILMLTMHGDGERITRLLSIPVDGYILKNKGAEQLVEAIYKLDSGRSYFNPEITEEMVRYKKIRQQKGELKLTPREEEVLRLIALAFTTPQISEKLFIAQSTVETHRRNLIGKLGVKGTSGLVRWASEHGYIEKT